MGEMQSKNERMMERLARLQAEEQKMAAGHVKVKVRVARSPIPLDARPVCALFVSKDGC